MTMYSWGTNSSNQLGIQSANQGFFTPTQVSFPSQDGTPITIAAGGQYAMCLTSKRKIFVWGSGENGQLGLGSAITECVTPTCVLCFAMGSE